MSVNTSATNDDKNYTIYRTADLYFSSFLCAVDIEMITTEAETNESGNKKVVFVFRIPNGDGPQGSGPQGGQTLAKLKGLYFGGSGTVKVQKYVQALRSLKSLCFI